MAEKLDINLRSDLEHNPADARSPLVRAARWWWDVISSWAPALILVLAIRSSLFEPFQIPSGSMVPTLAIGDFILVSKFGYGLRVPFTDIELIPLGEPERGDVVVFRHPPSESADPYCAVKDIPRWPSRILGFFVKGRNVPPPCSTDYIKRIVGLPGDTVSLRDSVLYVNDVEQPRVKEGTYRYTDNNCSGDDLHQFTETLDGRAHTVLQSSSFTGRMGDFGPVTVPAEHYFMMGDNRDHSSDSRVWGFVPRDFIKGRATFVWLSLDPCQGRGTGFGAPRTERIGTAIE